jgi:hypothetical protein
MSSNQVIHALYDDDDTLLSAVKSIREKKHHIEEVYTPFPVHGLDKALGLADTRISIMAFIGCHFDDELYHDRRLAAEYRWKAQFFLFGKYARLCPHYV